MLFYSFCHKKNLSLHGSKNGGVFLSINNGTSWTAVNTSLTNMDVWSFAVSGTNFFAGTRGGVRRRPLSDMLTSVWKDSPQTCRRISV
jgi:hypothetical protein